MTCLPAAASDRPEGLLGEVPGGAQPDAEGRGPGRPDAEVRRPGEAIIRLLDEGRTR
jgi:hypothetical protein